MLMDSSFHVDDSEISSDNSSEVDPDVFNNGPLNEYFQKYYKEVSSYHLHK
jgi:hypothetical protein